MFYAMFDNCLMTAENIAWAGHCHSTSGIGAGASLDQPPLKTVGIRKQADTTAQEIRV